MAFCEEHPVVTSGSHHEESVSFFSFVVDLGKLLNEHLSCDWFCRQHDTHVIVL